MKEGTNLCGIAKRVQQRILAPRPVVAAIKRLALAPAAATNDHQTSWRVRRAGAIAWARFGLRHDIRSVSDELAIDAKNGFERAFDLRGRVILRLQSTHGRFDQPTQNGDIFGNSEAKMNVRMLHRSNEGSMEWIL